MKHLVILVSLFLCGILQLSAQTEAAQTNKAQANTAQANTARSHAKPIVTNLEISYAHGYSAYEWDYYGVDIAPILFAGEKASLGIGAGVHNYAWGFPDNFGEGEVVIPFYLDFRYYPITTKFAPYALLKAGYAGSFGDITGVYGQTGIGLKYSYHPKHDLFFNMTYGIQNFQAKDSWYPKEKNSSSFKYIEAVGVALGWKF